MSNLFADVSSTIIALADPSLSQPDMEREMVSPPAGAYITSFTIYHVLPDLPAVELCNVQIPEKLPHLVIKLCRMYVDLTPRSGTPGAIVLQDSICVDEPYVVPALSPVYSEQPSGNRGPTKGSHLTLFQSVPLSISYDSQVTGRREVRQNHVSSRCSTYK